MRHEISTTITINAPLRTVWNHFFDFASYPQWNPFIKSIKGKIALNHKFEVEIGTMKFSPVVTELNPLEVFSWQGKLLFKGLFDGRHSFNFTENPDGSTTMIQKESFSGILVRFLRKKLDSEIVEGFRAMNQALKER